MRRATGGVLLGLAAAASFGAGTPFAKRLLDDARPQLLAGLLYAGAFVALAATRPARDHAREARLRRADLPRLAGLTIAGGIAAPLLLLAGLDRVQGTTAALLLNLEGPFTLALGVAVFAEHLGRRPALGAACIFGGAGVLAAGGGAAAPDAVGVACIAAACLLWACDNNLTQSLTLRDPFDIVTVKAGVAAAVNVSIALARGDAVPAAGVLAGALALGAVSYGASVVLDAYALRALGAAREAAIFATAPFAGALLALPVLGESLGGREVLAGAAMAAGVGLLLTEAHDHLHAHAALVHDHRHDHDEHHRHDHPPGVDPAGPHAHPHRHDTLVHAHPHVSDVHHRHRH